jgi:hypothetical protein
MTKAKFRLLRYALLIGIFIVNCKFYLVNFRLSLPCVFLNKSRDFLIPALQKLGRLT